MKKNPERLTIEQVITRRRNKALDSRDTLALILRILGLALAVWLLLSQVFVITQVSGNSMFPALKDGDLVIGFRLQKEYAKNDVVLFRQEGKTQLGRIIARGTDVVTMDDTGTLLVNGTPQSGEILYPTYAKEGYEYPLRVPEDALFLLGDYRTQCTDSRDFGPVNLNAVEAKVITILRRRGL
ncbi:MAG: signal peptidase I [Eubacteriales bacterium]|nr:signal peptidase I [Eubacteriales bacterium]